MPRRRVAAEMARLFAEHGMVSHPAEIRKLAAKFCGERRDVAELDAYLRATFRLDPTGVMAVRNVARQRGAR